MPLCVDSGHPEIVAEMNVTDEDYLAALKSAGKEDIFVAEKLGISVSEVRKRWKSFLKSRKEKPAAQFSDVSKLQFVISSQMDLLGQSVKLLSSALSDRMSSDDLRKLILQCPEDEDLASWLRERVTILRPFSLELPGLPPSSEV